jgi:putative spermidine/putrescine transport system permease protein
MTEHRMASRWGGRVLFAIVAAYLLVPMLAAFLYSTATVWQARILPDGYTLDHYVTVFADPRILASIVRSLVLAVLVTIIDIAIVVPAAYWARVRNPRIRPIVEVGAAIPFALPYLVIAYGILKTTGAVMPSLQHTFGLLLIAQVAICFPFLYWAVDGAMSASNILRLSEAAETCGARPWQVIWRVVLPAIRIGIASGGILVFAASFGEFALAQVLVGPSFETLPLWQSGALLDPTSGRPNELAVTTVLSFVLLFVLSALLVAWNRGGVARLLPSATPTSSAAERAG